MKRKIIHIDEEKCSGCGVCAAACHEGAIGMVNGKAKLLRDDYCDGLGDCLPACPTNAITFTEREAAEYDRAAVEAHKQAKAHAEAHSRAEDTLPCGCPGTTSRSIDRREEAPACQTASEPVSRLSQWPVQIKLAPVNAPYFKGAKLLIAATCSAYAYANFHEKFIRGRVTLVGCPKLDGVEYAEKLTAILQANDIESVTVVRMEVPCCGGLVNSVKTALQRSGKFIPWQIVTISTEGEILD